MPETHAALQDALDALATRLEAMIPEDQRSTVIGDFASAGLFIGLDVDPAELATALTMISRDNAHAVIIRTITELERIGVPIDVAGDVAAALHIGRLLNGHLAVGYVLGRLHRPDGDA